MDDIKILLERFYEGQTTQSEEQRLKEYFSKPDVDPRWTADRQLFRQLYAMDMPASHEAERRLAKQIDSWNRVEKTSERRTRVVGLRWIAGIAAGLLLLVTFTLFVQHRQQQQSYARQQDTFDNPQDAYARTEKALMKFSVSLNKGLNQIENATKK